MKMPCHPFPMPLFVSSVICLKSGSVLIVSPQSIPQTRLRLQKRMIGIDEDSSPDEGNDEAAAAAAKRSRDERVAKEAAKRRKARSGAEEARKGGGQKGPGH